MLRVPEPIDFDDDDGMEMPAIGSPLRVLAAWIAEHAGLDPRTGAMIDRDFSVLEVRGSA